MHRILAFLDPRDVLALACTCKRGIAVAFQAVTPTPSVHSVSTSQLQAWVVAATHASEAGKGDGRLLPILVSALAWRGQYSESLASLGFTGTAVPDMVASASVLGLRHKQPPRGDLYYSVLGSAAAQHSPAVAIAVARAALQRNAVFEPAMVNLCVSVAVSAGVHARHDAQLLMHSVMDGMERAAQTDAVPPFDRHTLAWSVALLAQCGTCAHQHGDIARGCQGVRARWLSQLERMLDVGVGAGKAGARSDVGAMTPEGVNMAAAPRMRLSKRTKRAGRARIKQGLHHAGTSDGGGVSAPSTPEGTAHVQPSAPHAVEPLPAPVMPPPGLDDPAHDARDDFAVLGPNGLPWGLLAGTPSGSAGSQLALPSMADNGPELGLDMGPSWPSGVHDLGLPHREHDELWPGTHHHGHDEDMLHFPGERSSFHRTPHSVASGPWDTDAPHSSHGNSMYTPPPAQSEPPYLDAVHPTSPMLHSVSPPMLPTMTQASVYSSPGTAPAADSASVVSGGTAGHASSVPSYSASAASRPTHAARTAAALLESRLQGARQSRNPARHSHATMDTRLTSNPASVWSDPRGNASRSLMAAAQSAAAKLAHGSPGRWHGGDDTSSVGAWSAPVGSGVSCVSGHGSHHSVHSGTSKGAHSVGSAWQPHGQQQFGYGGSHAGSWSPEARSYRQVPPTSSEHARGSYAGADGHGSEHAAWLGSGVVTASLTLQTEAGPVQVPVQVTPDGRFIPLQ